MSINDTHNEGSFDYGKVVAVAASGARTIEVALTASDEVDKVLCEDTNNVPTGWNMYLWAKENPDTTISHSISRIEKIFDEADEVFFGFSAGKDSTLSANMAIMELKRRWARVAAGIDRKGNEGIDPLDEKWVGKKLWGNSMHAEWIWSNAIKHTDEFVQKHGPLGDGTINFFYKCLQLGWQSGVSFGESRITSWDPEKKDMWIMPMPRKEDIGIDPVTNDNIRTVNPVRLDSLSPEIQKMRREDGSVFKVGPTEMVANFGLGSADLNWGGDYRNVKWECWTFAQQDEDQEQETFAAWLLEQFPNGTKIYNLISLRAAESFDRFTILRQSDYSTGHYATNKQK